MKTLLQFYIFLFLFFITPLDNLFAQDICNGSCDAPTPDDIKDYYVDGADGDTSGDNSNLGDDWSSAFLTIGQALLKADESGDVIHVRSGVYNLGGNPLTIYLNGLTLRSDDGTGGGNGNLDPKFTIIESTSDVIQFDGPFLSASTIVEGFTINVNNGKNGISVLSTRGATLSPRIRGNRIVTTVNSAGNHGIHVNADPVTSANPIIENNIISGPFAVGINIDGAGTKKPKIENNYIFDSSTDGISIATDNTNDIFFIKNNTVKHSGDNGVKFAFSGNLGTASPPIISHNLFKENGLHGFYLFSVASDMTASVFESNSILGNSNYGVYLHNGDGVLDIDLGGSGSSPGLNTLKNNFIYDLTNESMNTISAKHNWWINNSPMNGSEYDDIGGSTTNWSPALNNTLSFFLSDTTGDESGGNIVTINVDPNTYFVDKVGWPDTTTDQYRIEVKFGSLLASNVEVDPSSDSLMATVPAGTETVDVTITNPGGQTGTLAGAYTYIGSGDTDADGGNTAPIAPVLLYPLDGTTDISIRPTFAWKNSTDIDGDKVTYEINICEDQDFVGCSTISVTMSWHQMLTYAGIGSLAGGGLLFLLFASIGIRRMKHKTKLILSGLLLSGLLFTACTRTDGNGSDESGDLTEENVTTYTLAYDLKANTKYYWKVIAKDENGEETSSEILSFTTK